MNALESLLRPRSVAVIGATEDNRTFAGAPIHNLLRYNFPGAVYAVNPKREMVQGVPAYPTILDVPGPVDTVVIAVPAAAVLGVLGQCVEKGVQSATVVTSGFGEEAAGADGAERAAQLEELVRRSGIRVLGPNTAGLANLVDSYVPRAAHNQLDPDQVAPGPMALITQSGACGNIVFNRAQAHGVHVGLSVATGDQVDIDVWELCEFAIDDPRFLVVAVVAETLGRIDRLERVALRAAAAGKVVAVLKLGRSEAGSRAVLTHSGSIAGDAVVESAALRQLGLVELDDLDDLWRLAGLVQVWGPPPATPGMLGVVALSGGEGALIADRCSEYGLQLEPVSPAFAGFIRDNFAYASASNPFDPSGEIIGRPEKVRLALRAFLEMNDFTEVLVASPVLRPEQAERQLGEVGDILDAPRPRICFSYWSAGAMTETQARILRATGQPVFEGSGAAVRAIAHYRRAGARRRPDKFLERHLGSTANLSPTARYMEVRSAIAEIGIAFPDAVVVHEAAAAARAAGDLGFPVVMKANVRSSIHKAANGLIALDIKDASAARDAFTRLTEAGLRFEADGVVVERAAGGRVEVLVGATRDAAFGGTILFGSGGSMVEYLRDTAVGVARYTDAAEAENLVLATRAGRYLAQTAPAAVAALVTTVERAAGWFAANPQIASLDLNPLLVDPSSQAVVCVDARIA